jgi:sugar O-acyltransferase (sialic acid O-acetyltransferase NeuD family)
MGTKYVSGRQYAMKAWIIGAGAQGRVVLETLRAGGKYDSTSFLDDNPALQGTRVNGVEIIGGLDSALDGGCEGVHMIVALGNPLERMRLGSKIAARGGRLANAIHPTAVIAANAEMGCGNFVGANVVVNTDARIGNHVILNTGAIVEHDCVLGDGAAVGMGAILGGRVSVERSSFLSAGVTVISRVCIGSETVVGAGSVVTRDLPANVLAWGVPARVIQPIVDFDWRRVL